MPSVSTDTLFVCPFSDIIAIAHVNIEGEKRKREKEIITICNRREEQEPRISPWIRRREMEGPRAHAGGARSRRLLSFFFFSLSPPCRARRVRRLEGTTR